MSENIDRIELRRIKTKMKRVKVVTSRNAYNYIKQFWSDDITIYESFFILLLNRSSDTIGYAKISQGGVVGTVFDVSIVAKYAIDSLATAVILAHNHPSSGLQPSEQDKAITKKIKKALSLFGIRVVDHIILTESSYFSFADKDLI